LFSGVSSEPTYELRNNVPSFGIVHTPQPPQSINIKVGSYSNDPKMVQNLGSVPISNNVVQSVVINQQQTLPNANSNSIASTLYHQFTNEVRPTITPTEPKLPDLQIFQQSQTTQAQPAFI